MAKKQIQTKIKLQFELLNQDAPEKPTDQVKDSTLRSAISTFDGKIVM